VCDDQVNKPVIVLRCLSLLLNIVVGIRHQIPTTDRSARTPVSTADIREAKMKGLTSEQALYWIKNAGLSMNEERVLGYENATERFFIAAPTGFRDILMLSRAVAIFGGEAGFSGGLLWLERWDIGSPQMVRVGWQTMEDLRRARGDMQSLDVAPAQYFRDDEIVPLQIFLLNVIGLGLVADFIPAGRHLFVRFKDNGQICFTSDEADTVKELRTTFSRWNPTEEDPMAVRLREFERLHDQDS
jgi:hypothetical protein